MIDFVKIVIRDIELLDRVWNNQLLIFLSNQDRRFNDEIRTFRKKTYKGLTFTLFADKLEIKGSLHKYFNVGLHNANDFSFVHCIQVIKELESIFKLDLSQCFIENIEFGINVIPDESVKNIVVWLKFHERNEFRLYPELQYAKQAGSFSSNGRINQYKIIKAYAKGLQQFEGKTFGNSNTFRFEVKSKQGKYFNRFGIYTLSDLTLPTVYIRLSGELLIEWKNVLLIDKTLPKTKKTEKYISSDFWENCINEYRNKFSNQKKQYFSLLNHYPDNLHKQIYNLLESKLNLFTNELKIGAISTEIKLNEKNKSGAYSTIVKDESAPICIVTGLPIHNQQSKTKNLTPKGVKWYFDNEPDTYRLKLESLLTEKWKQRNRNKTKDVWFAEIAHQIRNRKNNPKNNPRNNTKNSYRKLESKGLKLWPTKILVNPDKLQLIEN